ncbi:MAG: TonB-dependent receptor [Pseudomonadota bacterium]
MKRLRSFSATKTTLLASAISAVLASYTVPTFAQEEELEEITVTGSRIVRRDLSAPSPVVTVGSESFQKSSTGAIESVLNQLPQFVPSSTQFSSSIQNSATSTPGAATLNLRGLGTNRNLILIDGRRAQPSNAALVVDVNTIPSAAIANVEVITGGASAVYGPDAMAGVVNFMLKKDFEGMEVDFQTGRTFEGDADENRFSTLFGLNSADGRGNIMVGLDWMKRSPAFTKDRDFYIDGWSDPGNNSGGFVMARSFFPTAGNGPSQAAVNALFPTLPAGTVGASSEIRFNEDGTPFVDKQGYGYKGPLNCFDTEACGVYGGMTKKANGDLQQWFTEGYVSTPLERHSLFLRSTYEIADHIEAYAQANYSRVEVTQRGGIPPAITVWQAPSVPRDGRPLPAALNSLLDSRLRPADPWALFQVLEYNGPIEPVNTNDVWQFLVGLKGDLMDGDWTWDAYASRGDTRIVAENYRNPSLQRYQDMVYAPNFGKGIVTRADGGRGYSMTCTTGLPVFQDFEPSANCLDSIDTRMINRSVLTQEILEANLQGGLFALPAGEVRFAAGAAYRGNTFSFQPGNPVGQLRDNPIGVFASAGTAGKINVREYYGELLVPVVGDTDIPLIHDIDLELGYRYSDFSTAGGQDTYKALFTWDLSEQVTVRGGYQFATRAPNIAELFTAPTQEVVPFPNQDPCSVTTLSAWGNVPGNPNRAKVINLCRAIIGNSTSQFDTQTFSIRNINGPEGFHRQNPPFFPLEIALRKGNPDVAPEQGETFTLGAVISEPFGWESISATIDAYRIEISDAISPLNVATVYEGCFNSNGASNPTYDINNSWCKMIRRNPITGDREEVDTPFFNLGTLETQGIDLTLNWSQDVGPGVASINSTLNYLDNFEYQLAPGAAIADATGTLDQGGLFEFISFTRFGYSLGDLNLGINWRHMSSIDSAAKATVPTTTIQGPGSYDMFSFNSSYNWDKYTFRFGIDNLLDEDPELTQSNPRGGDTDSDVTNPGLYDLLGRRWYVGVQASF